MACLNLSLSSLRELHYRHPPVSAQPVAPPVRKLKVLHGYSCLLCHGQYLTTSLELMQRHCFAKHVVKCRTLPRFEACEMQSLFQKTKHRRYFRAKKSQRPNEGQAYTVARDVDIERSFSELNRHASCESSLALATKPSRGLKIWHPFAQIAKRHVRWLPLSYVDHLFKSGSFQSASEPLFNPSHADADQGMQAVFPYCDDDPLFYHAHLFSMVQYQKFNTANQYADALKIKTTKMLRDKLDSPLPTDPTPLIGAILILKATAYKSGDLPSHNTHAQGLAVVLTYYGESSIPHSIKRALFWQDAYAELLVDCPRQVSTIETFAPILWLRNTSFSRVEVFLPLGFSRYLYMIPTILAECIVDLLDLQARHSNLQSQSFDLRYHQLDSMQASIELRLIQQAQACRLRGPVIEATRLSVLLCCYCSWTEIWNDDSIPCKIAGKLFDAIEPIVTTKSFDWFRETYLDLMIWFLFVASSVVELDRSHLGKPRARRKQILSQATYAFGTSDTKAVNETVDGALQDFVYCAHWRQTRLLISDWCTFEAKMRNDNSGNRNALLVC